MMKNKLKLICENEFTCNDLILEVQADNVNSEKKICKIIGPYIVTETKNANGRVYKAADMERVVKQYHEDFIDVSRAVGEMNHPESVEIDFVNACHRVTSLKRDGNIWVGESIILTGTPKGDLLKALIEGGVKVGMSTRGVGSTDSNNIVQDYKLLAVDVVSNPSGPGAFVNGILESKNYMVDQHGEIIEIRYRELEKSLEKLPLHTELKRLKIVEAFSTFLKKI